MLKRCLTGTYRDLTIPNRKVAKLNNTDMNIWFEKTNYYK